MKAIDIIEQLPGELAARLQCDPFFADIAVVVAEKGNVAAEFARQQAVIQETSGKRGIAVIVLQIVANDFSSNLQFGPMILKPAFQVVENVELNNDGNGTKKSARKVARKIRDVIKNCNLMGLVQDMKSATPCIEPVDLGNESYVAHQVNFECLEVSNEVLTQVQLPVIAAAGAPSAPQFTISCPTLGAAIWFTTDDSFPFNGDKDTYPNSTAQLYSGPVNLAAGATVVRAAAYLDGSIASGVNRATLFVTPT
jgi:hypothetical protein